MIRGTATMQLSEKTVIEAMQAWIAANFCAEHAPKCTGFKLVSNAGYGGSCTYELALAEVEGVEGP